MKNFNNILKEIIDIENNIDDNDEVIVEIFIYLNQI